MCALKTFIVEDSLVIRESLIATLEELAPVDVVGTAEDEATAVQWLSQPGNAFDLIIVDIFLKHGTGLGVISAASALTSKHKLVVLTNYATVDMRVRCLALGADKVFDKSNEIESLLSYCVRLVSGETGNSTLGGLAPT
jgi:DNA-binding NarL/FixJ family response regulator